jgi:hypothetical protein
MEYQENNIILDKSFQNYMFTEDRINYFLSFSLENNKQQNIPLSTNINPFIHNSKWKFKTKPAILNNNNTNEKSCPIPRTTDSFCPKKQPFFIPKQKDTLFWCFYVMVNGINKYETIDYINIVVEKTMKIEYIEKLRKKKDLIKTYKFASILHIENMLANETKIDIKTFMSLCLLENVNVLFINNNIFYELEMNSLSKFHILHFFPNKFSYGIEEELDTLKNIDIKREEYKKSLYQIFNLDKPIKAISSYKCEDLVEISSKLGINIINNETKKQMLKKDIYTLIIQKLSI